MQDNGPYVYIATGSEVKLARMIAEARCDLKLAHNVRSKKYSIDKSETDIHILGILGEFAVSTCLGIPLKMPITIGGDDGFDMISREIGRISVKTRSRANYDFALTKAESEKHWDIGILVCPKGVEIRPPYDFVALRLVGWIGKEDFQRRATSRDYGYGVRLAVGNRALSPMVDIKHRTSACSVRSLIDLHGLGSAFREITNG